MDEAARAAKLDPVEIRRRNFVPPDAFPHRTPFGVSYDSGNYARALDRVVELADYHGLRRAQAEARERGGIMGIGVATYVEGPKVTGWAGRAGSFESNGAARSPRSPDRAHTDRGTRRRSRRSSPIISASPSTTSSFATATRRGRRKRSARSAVAAPASAGTRSRRPPW